MKGGSTWGVLEECLVSLRLLDISPDWKIVRNVSRRFTAPSFLHSLYPWSWTWQFVDGLIFILRMECMFWSIRTILIPSLSAISALVNMTGDIFQRILKISICIIQPLIICKLPSWPFTAHNVFNFLQGESEQNNIQWSGGEQSDGNLLVSWPNIMVASSIKSVASSIITFYTLIVHCNFLHGKNLTFSYLTSN